jgi:hypothetical protein
MFMVKCCGNCNFFKEDYPIENNPIDEQFGVCYYKVGPLPISWRYVRSEVVQVWGFEGNDCKCFLNKIKETNL